MPKPRDEPTPQEIARRAALIRTGWSDDEHYIRAGMTPPDERDLQPHRLRGFAEPMESPVGAD